jgi:hypothetical protein
MHVGSLPCLRPADTGQHHLFTYIPGRRLEADTRQRPRQCAVHDEDAVQVGQEVQPHLC